MPVNVGSGAVTGDGAGATASGAAGTAVVAAPGRFGRDGVGNLGLQVLGHVGGGLTRQQFRDIRFRHAGWRRGQGSSRCILVGISTVHYLRPFGYIRPWRE